MSAEIYMDPFLSQMLHFSLCVLGIVVSIEVPKIAVIFRLTLGYLVFIADVKWN